MAVVLLLRQVRRALEYAEKGVRLNPHSSDALYAHATMLHKKAVTAVKDAAVPIPAQMGLLDRAADAFRRLQVRTTACCCVCRLGVDVKVGVLGCGFFGLLLSVMSRFASCQAQSHLAPQILSLARAIPRPDRCGDNCAQGVDSGLRVVEGLVGVLVAKNHKLELRDALQHAGDAMKRFPKVRSS